MMNISGRTPIIISTFIALRPTKEAQRSSSFWLPRNLSNRMDRQARTGDTVLFKSREMTEEDPITAVAAGGEGVKTTENMSPPLLQNHVLVALNGSICIFRDKNDMEL
jgi:hypothetical protein